jgi:predicted TIM-barrel fold metal-dependent hydrolase
VTATLDSEYRQKLLDRFLRYVKVDTRSDEASETTPTTEKQKDLSRMLAEELKELGCDDAEMNEIGIVTATVPGNLPAFIRAFPQDLNDTFLEGFAVLEELELSYDNWSPDYRRLPRLAELASRFPGVTVIVNHLGGQIDPAASDDEISIWKAGIDAVAACPNTVMKLGGAQMRVGEWEPPYHMHVAEKPMSSDDFLATLLPWYQYAMEAFGPERCMFESNFPVDRECISYRTLWNLFKKMAAELCLSDAEKTAVFSGTAARAYRLTPP